MVLATRNANTSGGNSLMTGPKIAPGSPRANFRNRIYGSLLRGLREERGYLRRQELCDDLLRKQNLSISERVLGEIENGNREATLPENYAFVMLLRPENGIHYFLPAYDPDGAPTFMRLNCTRRPVDL